MVRASRQAMKATKTVVAAFLSLILFSVTQASYLTPLTNLNNLKHSIILYHESGAFDYDVSKVADCALHYLQARIKENNRLPSPKKLAIVLDIDETSLSNYKDLKALEFGGTIQMQIAAEGRADDPAISSTVNLFRYARTQGVTVFFVTGRTEAYREATIKNLVAAGYDSVKESTKLCENLSEVTPNCMLFLRDGQYLNTSAIPYKTAMREKIEKAGYDIVINLGDQYSDLAGGYSERTYKYPNYLYYIN